MTKVGIYVLMSLLLTLQVRYTMVQLDYLVHKEQIISELCIERDVPESTCEGKCHLKKELTKLDEQHDERGNTPIQLPVSSIDFISETNPTELEAADGDEVDQRITWFDEVLLTRASAIESPPPEVLALAQ